MAQANPLLPGSERTSGAGKAQAQAGVCANWSKGELVEAFRRATLVDVERCLKTGVDLTIRDRNGRTPLHVAAETTGHPDIVSRLVEAGANVMAKTDDRARDTPLHLAAQHNPNVAVVARLIDLGAEVNAENRQRWQPLHRAAWRNPHPEIAALLIRRGADTTTTVPYRAIGSTRWLSVWELARLNPPLRNSDWYRELEDRRFEGLGKQSKEQDRLAEDARHRQRTRLAEKAAAIEKQRNWCEPALDQVGLVSSWRKRSQVIAALKDDNASPHDACADAIPFLLAGAGKYPEVEEAFAARILRDIERWANAGIQRKSETLTVWIGISRLLRENCLHDIADFIVVSVVSRAVRDFGAIVWWETVGGPLLVQPDVMRALDSVPQRILADVSATGRVHTVPPMFDLAIKATAKADAERVVGSCVDYFNAQSELRKGQSLTPVQRAAITEMCSCFHEQARAKGYLSNEPKFTEIMAELTDPNHMLSEKNIDFRWILGRCAVLHGESLG